MEFFAVFIIGATLVLNADGEPRRPFPPTTPRSAIDPFQNVTVPTCTTRDSVIRVRNGVIDTKYRWTTFYVYPDKNFNNQERQAINDAIWHLQQVLPCVGFGIWPADSNPTGDYVHIIKGSNNGCSSYVGRLGGRQNMNLQSPGCMNIGTIIHEMIHALGFQHEHCRSDRDDYVEIHYGNILPGQQYNFHKFSSQEVTTFGVPYNYRSIMHYSGNAFSSNGGATITAKTGEPVGSIGVLQQTDIQKLLLMYAC